MRSIPAPKEVLHVADSSALRSDLVARHARRGRPDRACDPRVAASAGGGRGVPAAYRTLKPLLDGAYHLLGYPGRSFDEPARRALQRIVDAPVRERVVVERSGARWVFADASLEALGPVEKQLLRMGARN